MTEETKKAIEQKFDGFLKIAEIEDENVKAIFKDDFIKMMDTEEFDKEAYKESYFNLFSKVYDYMLIKAITPNLTTVIEEDLEISVPTIKTKDITSNNMANIIDYFDIAMTNSTKLVFNDANYKDVLLGGYTENEFLAKLTNVHQDETAQSEYLRTRDTNKSYLEEGLEYCKKAKTFSKLPYMAEDYNMSSQLDLAADYFEKKVAAAYCQMRQEHRSHNFLWRWFMGKESRARLNELKAAYCEAFGFRTKTATTRMLSLLDKRAPVQSYHNAVITHFEKNKVLNTIKEKNELDGLDEFKAVTTDQLVPQENIFTGELEVCDIKQETDINNTIEKVPFDLDEKDNPVIEHIVEENIIEDDEEFFIEK